MKSKKISLIANGHQMRKPFYAMILAVSSFLFLTFLPIGITSPPTTLFDVTYIGGDPSQPATVSRLGINYTIYVSMKILDGDYLSTNTQRVQLTDNEGGKFRFGPHTEIEVREVNFTIEGFALYLDLGEMYAAHKCVKIRSSCWAKNYVGMESYYFASFDGYVGQYDAVLGGFEEGEYDEFGVFHKDYDIPEGYSLRMTGWPPAQVFELVETPEERLNYIAVNYQDDSLWTGPVGGIWVPVDKFSLLAPYIGLASTILVATVATSIYVKHVKRRKEK